MNNEKQIFFHVGLGKTGTTYLQYNVFPCFEKISYVQRSNYHNFEYVEKVNSAPEKNVLVSREFDHQLEEECKKIHSVFSNAKIIIVFRKHGSWLASQYRRSVKNGYADSFQEYVSLGTKEGVFNHDDMIYFNKIKFLENLFKSKPLVLFYEDMKQDPFTFFDTICKFTGASYKQKNINLHPKHKSYNEQQLKAIRKLNGKIFHHQFGYSKNKYINQMQRIFRMLPRYTVLYAAKIFPKDCFGEKPLIPFDEIKAIDNYYGEDWKNCRQYAAERNKNIMPA
ncbi:MAG: sulfotransferase domain-containing protein [Bacteroidota bacterium]